MEVPENLTANLHLLWPAFLITGLAFLVLTVDFLLPAGRKSSLAAIAAVGLLAILAFSVLFLGGREDTPLYQGILQVDRYSLFFTVFFLALGVLIVLASVDYVKRYLRHPGEYYGIILFSILGMVLMAASAELLTAYISLELLSFSLYILVSLARDDPKSNEAGVKYILLGAFASALLLYGISLVYGVLGTTTFAGINEALGAEVSARPAAVATATAAMPQLMRRSEVS